MNTNAMKQALRNFYIFAVVSTVIMVIAAWIISNHWEDIQNVKYKIRAKENPQEYSVCLVCKKLKPHKIQHDYKVGVWVDDECSARYTLEDMWVRVNEELRRRKNIDLSNEK